MRNRLVVGFVLLVVLFPAIGFGSEEAVVADFFVRPLGFAALVVGSAAFVVALPVSVVVGGTDSMAEVLVKRPYRFTFQRDMGEGLEISEQDSGR